MCAKFILASIKTERLVCTATDGHLSRLSVAKLLFYFSVDADAEYIHFIESKKSPKGRCKLEGTVNPSKVLISDKDL